MKSAFLLYMQYALLAIVFTISFSSCLTEKCEQARYYTYFQPVYMSYEELRASIKSQHAIPIKDAGKIYYKHPYLYVNEINKGIHVFDNTNPASPQNIAFINIPGNIDMAIRGNTLYADSYIDLVAIDITDVMQIEETDRIQNVFPNRSYGEGYYYDVTKGLIIDWIEIDTLVEDACNTNPFFAGEDVFFSNQFDGMNTTAGSGGSSTPGIGIAGSTARFALINNYLYCLAAGSMQLFDVSATNNIQPGDLVSMPWNIETIFPYENYLFIGASSGVYIYDNSSPTTPYLISEFTHVSSCDPVVVSNDIAYSTLRSGNSCMGFTNQLDIINIEDITNPQLIKSYNMRNPYGLGIDGDYLFVCDGPDGLEMYNVNDPLNIELLQTVPLENPVDVIPANGLLIVVTETAFYQFDYSSGVLNEVSHLSRR